MDIIGRVYRDYFIKDLIFDGKSHHINKFFMGGIGNILREEKLISYIKELCDIKFHIIVDKETKKIIETYYSRLNIDYIISEVEIPSSIILEKDNMRTSLVINDHKIKIKSINNTSKSALIYYGDKINIKDINNVETVYIDTAGNKYEDLFFEDLDTLKTIIISISSEYLTKELTDFYLKNNYILISHSPIQTEIITKESIVEIENKYYVNETINKVTGLGDKFFMIFSLYYNKSHKKSLYKSVIHAQKFIYSLIINDQIF